MLKINYIGAFNPFDWEAFSCPVCGGKEFESLSHSGVFCSTCDAQFRVRYTCGDPGCVVDCFVDPIPSGGSISAPAWECEECGAKVSLFDWQEHVCPVDKTHTKLRRIEHILGMWKVPKDYPTYFYLILKRGDYCSGWIWGNNLESLDHPSQEEWDEFQEKNINRRKK